MEYGVRTSVIGTEYRQRLGRWGAGRWAHWELLRPCLRHLPSNRLPFSSKTPFT